MHYEVWIEDFVQVLAEAKVLDAGDCFLVDEIYVKQSHRRTGLATQIIRKLESIKPVKPISIQDSECAVGFWQKLDMPDALGSSYNDTYQQLMLQNSEFDCKVVDEEVV